MAEATTAQPNTTGTPVGAPTGTGTPADWTQFITSILSLASGTGVLGNQGDLTKIAQMADPWGPQRAQYQTQLNDFMKDPSSVLKDPAFIAAQKVGAEDISRQAGAAGMAQSGNRLADLFSFGQSSALDFEKTKFNELSQLAGVNAGDPTALAKLLLQQKQAQGTNLTTGIAGVAGPIISALWPQIMKILGIGGTPSVYDPGQISGGITIPPIGTPTDTIPPIDIPPIGDVPDPIDIGAILGGG